MSEPTDTEMLDWLLSHSYYGCFAIELHTRLGSEICLRADRAAIQEYMRRESEQRKQRAVSSPTDETRGTP